MKLTIYNANGARQCNVYLPEVQDTIDYNGVDLALPRGTIVINYIKNFTHFKCTIDNREWIFEVKQKTCVAVNTWECEYEVDYLKDYWNSHKDKTTHIIANRCSNSNYLQKYKNDYEMPMQNKLTITKEVGNSIGKADNKVYIQVSTRTNAYLLDTGVNDWYFNKMGMNFPDLASSIQDSYLTPFTTPWSATDSVSWYKEDGQLQRDSGIALKCLHLDDNLTSSYFDIMNKTGLTINVNDKGLQYDKFILYIPYIGFVTLDPRKVRGSISCTYRLDPFQGTIQAYINDDVGNMTPVVPLPRNSILSSKYRNAENMLIAQALGGLATSATGLLLGGVGGAPTAMLARQGVANTMGMGNQLLQNATQLDNLVPDFTNPTFGNGIIFRDFVLYTIHDSGCMTFEHYGKTNGYLSLKYYEKLSELDSNTYFWLDLSTAVIYGAEWYVNGVKSAYHLKRIATP